MRFTFAPATPVSKYLYLVGIPAVVLMFLDRLLEWELVSEQTNLQIFLLGAIVVAFGGVINIGVTILQNLRRSDNTQQ